ncbi:hypothetical protein EJB05_07518, partial [Eragrostis curvula]
MCTAASSFGHLEQAMVLLSFFLYSTKGIWARVMEKCLKTITTTVSLLEVESKNEGLEEGFYFSPHVCIRKGERKDALVPSSGLL